ncbi:MAG TPA: Wadjet anti-phage system protein JetD domain-containing protein [Thermodesulfovibrionales bacterium]|nr:Wadjet anti-phage system protein JetD domain-containing protein [Thermodesulfovibrionales bacterium]
MNWTTPADLRAQVERLWNKGFLLASMVDGETLFPRRLTLKKPTSSELADRFEDVRTWIAELLSVRHYRIVMREVRHHVIGSNAVPDEIWIDTPDDALALIGKGRDARRFGELVELTRERQPAILPWLSRRPLKVLELAEDWRHLLNIIDWMRAHPRPGLYLRQIDIQGVHTKFIEAHRAVLSGLLDLVLRPETVDTETGGVNQFCRRYGFLDKPLRIRFRVLDPALALLPGSADQDITVTQDAFSQLDSRVGRVFITENEVNFLAFPNLSDSMVIFGAGYGFEMLAQAKWLHQCAIYYWGDIDTHGFAILDQLRAYFPHAQSFLMDRETLMAHDLLWVIEPQPLSRDLVRLSQEERALYDDLRDNRIGSSIRLEQERIRFGWVVTALVSLDQQSRI